MRPCVFLSICKKFIISHLFFDSFSQIISYNFWQWQSLYNVLSFHVSLRRYRKFSLRQIYHKIYSSVVCLKVFELVFWLVWHNVTYTGLLPQIHSFFLCSSFNVPFQLPVVVIVTGSNAKCLTGAPRLLAWWNRTTI